MKRRLNTETRNCVFSLSANGVGGEDRGEVARKIQISRLEKPRAFPNTSAVKK
jgi:hypothetical protein